MSRFLILLMLLAQLALAQHATVHFQEKDRHGIARQDQGHDHNPENDRFFSIHQFAGSLDKLLTLDGPVVEAPVVAGIQISAVFTAVFLQSLSSPYTARAPPSFSA